MLEQNGWQRMQAGIYIVEEKLLPEGNACSLWCTSLSSLACSSFASCTVKATSIPFDCGKLAVDYMQCVTANIKSHFVSYRSDVRLNTSGGDVS